MRAMAKLQDEIRAEQSLTKEDESEGDNEASRTRSVKLVMKKIVFPRKLSSKLSKSLTTSKLSNSFTASMTSKTNIFRRSPSQV